MLCKVWYRMYHIQMYRKILPDLSWKETDMLYINYFIRANITEEQYTKKCLANNIV